MPKSKYIITSLFPNFTHQRKSPIIFLEFVHLQPPVDKLKSRLYGVQPPFLIICDCSNEAKLNQTAGSKTKLSEREKMILADKIINERKKNGWSQEDLAEQLGVSRQAVSKWEGAQAIPDLNKIIAMAEIFGVSTDYLLKDELEPNDIHVMPATTDLASSSLSPVKKITMEEASEFLKIKEETAPTMALGTSLLVSCPVVLIFMAGLSDYYSTVSEGVAAAVGLIVLFLQIALGITIFMLLEKKTKRFDYLKTEEFETEYGVDGMVKEKRLAFENKALRNNIIGVLLCVCSVVPLIVCACLDAPDFILVCMVCLLLTSIAIATNLFVRTGEITESHKILLLEDDYSSKGKKETKKYAPLSGAYWCIITAIFLGWGFMTHGWNKCWMVWPIAGVLYAALMSIIKTAAKKD